jgi:hypothetical protein
MSERQHFDKLELINAKRRFNLDPEFDSFSLTNDKLLLFILPYDQSPALQVKILEY